MTIRHISRLVIPDGIWYTADGICAGGGSRMCCRYYLEESPELRPIVEAMNRSPLVARFQEKGAPLFRGEIRPTDTAPVIATSRSGARAVFPMRWGFSGKSLLINAKTETAAAKPTFREAWTSHRCIVPASWYFEWEHLTAEDGKKRTGSKFMLHAKDAPVTWMCGLYRMEEGLPCFVILEGFCVRFPCKDVSAMLFIPQDRDDPAVCPVGVIDTVFPAATCWYCQLSQRISNFPDAHSR